MIYLNTNSQHFLSPGRRAISHQVRSTPTRLYQQMKCNTTIDNINTTTDTHQYEHHQRQRQHQQHQHRQQPTQDQEEEQRRLRQQQQNASPTTAAYKVMNQQHPRCEGCPSPDKDLHLPTKREEAFVPERASPGAACRRRAPPPRCRSFSNGGEALTK